MIFLYGENTFSSLRELKKIVKEKREANLRLSFFDLEEDNPQELLDQSRSRNIFNQKEVVIIKNPFNKSSFLWENKVTNSKHLLVFYHRGDIPKKDKFAKLLRKEADNRRFEKLEKGDLKKWAIKEFERYNSQINSQGLKALLERTGGDLWRLSQEINKLSNWKKKVQKEDIERFIPPKIEDDIFKIIDSVANQKQEKALKLLHGALERGESPIYLISMIAYQFSNLLAVKDKLEKQKNPSELDLHPFVIKKSTWMAKNFEMKELITIFERIKDLDYDIKTGRIEPELALDLLLHSIVSGN